MHIPGFSETLRVAFSSIILDLLQVAQPKKIASYHADELDRGTAHRAPLRRMPAALCRFSHGTALSVMPPSSGTRKSLLDGLVDSADQNCYKLVAIGLATAAT
jgi:hypothetical protein